MKIGLHWFFVALFPVFLSGYCVGDLPSGRDSDRSLDRTRERIEHVIHNEAEETRRRVFDEATTTRVRVIDEASCIRATVVNPRWVCR